MTSFQIQISRLKEKALEFPLYYMEQKNGTTWVTSIVFFKYEDKIYKRHHVESIVETKTVKPIHAIKRLIERANQTIEFGLPSQFDEL